MNPVCITDYRELARRRLPRVLFDYIEGGAFGEDVLRRNVGDFDKVRLRQRVLKDVASIDLTTQLFGQPAALPVVLAPVGMSGFYARRGECQAARAARAAGAPMCLSTMAVCDIAEVTRAYGAPIWFQLYMIKDRGYMRELLAEARAQDCQVLAFTVDLPVGGIRYRDMRTGTTGRSLAKQAQTVVDGLTHPDWLWDVQVNGRPHTFGNLARAIPDARGFADFWGWVGSNFDPSISWKDLDWVREQWDRPILLKGILDVEDARTAAKAGVEGIVVSNHGGRQLDGCMSSIEALPAIADAVGDKLTLLMDGGVRSGLDVVKALALGARGVMIGRPWAWGLAARGQAGVAHVLDILKHEMTVAMQLCGAVDVKQAGPDLLVAA